MEVRFLRPYDEAHRLTLLCSKAAHVHVRRSHLIAGGVILFTVGIVIVGERFTFAVVIARLIDALGDVAFDRGMPEIFRDAANDVAREG